MGCYLFFDIQKPINPDKANWFEFRKKLNGT